MVADSLIAPRSTAAHAVSLTSDPLTAPNLYQLSGPKGLHITYSTTGFDGKPHFDYQAGGKSLHFTGNQIRTVDLEIGELVTVTTQRTIDRGSTTFSVLIPQINLGSRHSAPINTQGIVTTHRFSVPPLQGQLDSYQIIPLKGTAQAVFF